MSEPAVHLVLDPAVLPVLYCLALIPHPTTSREEVIRDSVPPPENVYNYLDLVLQWGPGLCYQSHCRDELPDTWTLHGLWPSVNYTTWPQNCAESCDLDLSVLPPDLVEKMRRQWPTVYKGRDEQFWEHEYCKHGTCCDDILPGPAPYFQEGIKLLNSVDTDDTLRAGQITPHSRKSYKFSALEAVVRDRLGLNTVRYWCREKEDKQILYQLGLCVSKSLTLTDCPSGDFKHSCDKEESFYLLPLSVALKQLLDTTLLILVIFWM